MSVDVNIFKVIPENLGKGFGFCVFGEITSEVMDLASQFNLQMEKTEKYTNFFPTAETDFAKMFFENKGFKYLDGFSPNLNKHLHIGHFSNLVLAKAFQSMGVAKNTVAILGDTLNGEVSKEEALQKFYGYCEKFKYKIDKVFFASEMKYDGELLDGEEKYAGTKIIQAGDEKIVVIKADGSTSYFYQDMAFAKMLGEETLYLTGYEQVNHFGSLKKLFPHVNHIGLGLVKFQSNKLEGENGKMSTRLGNVIFMSDLLNDLKKEFGDNELLCYNIFAGYILKNHPESDKVFNIDTIKNPKNSPGLYLSYTMARLKSAGVEIKYGQDNFNKQELQYSFLKSKSTLNPVHLFNSLVNLCKEINTLYMDHKIAGNEDNKKMFELLLSDLSLGMKKIGMFEVDKV
jgi:arginyl-tRNA synthetase